MVVRLSTKFRMAMIAALSLAQPWLSSILDKIALEGDWGTCRRFCGRHPDRVGRHARLRTTRTSSIAIQTNVGNRTTITEDPKRGKTLRRV
jgi:hypothetical protein